MVASHDLVFTFFRVTWSAAARSRNATLLQARLAERLVTDERIRRTVLADPFRSLPLLLARRVLRQERPHPRSDRVRPCHPIRLRRSEPVDARALERSARSYDAALRRSAVRAGMSSPAVLTLDPFVAAFAPLEWAGPVTFHAIDDLSAHYGYARWQAVYEEVYDRIRRSGRAVSAVSSEIIERIRPSGRSLVAPNGISPDEWTHPGPSPAWFQRLPQPRLLYAGSLDSRIDVDLVRAAAEVVPGGSLTLVGNVFDESHTRSLNELANVTIHPPVGREDVVALTASADACIVPHVRSRLTVAMSPLKLYEALAAGRPVAAVDLPPMRGIDDRVVLADDDGPAAFAAAVRRALSFGPASEEQRLAFIAANAWARQHDKILQLALRDGPDPASQSS